MGLPETRKLLSVIITVVTAIATAALIIAFVMSSTVSSISFFEKIAISGELVSACEEQLDSKYTVLEAETGIPKRVFDRAKDDYKIEDTLKGELMKAYNGERTPLYDDSMVEYFTRLCTEFLDESDTKYDKKNVETVGKKAAEIYSETVGFKGTELTASRLSALKNRCSKAELVSVLAILTGTLLLAIIYANRQKGLVYTFCGIAAGGAGAAAGALLSCAFDVWGKLAITPAALNTAVSKALATCCALTAAAGIIIAVAAYIVFLILFRKIGKKEERSIVV